jgi:hypothetical protein
VWQERLHGEVNQFEKRAGFLGRHGDQRVECPLMTDAVDKGVESIAER